MNKKVSVIITCYNLGKYLGDAIKSVQNQTYSDWEIIIVDDGSTDPQTLTFLKSYQEKTGNVHYQPNEGVSVARNNGAAIANGDFILFLDGDDKIGTTYLEKAMAIFENNSVIDYVYCDLQEFEEGHKERILPDLCLETQVIYHIPHTSGIMKKSFWEKTGGFDVNFKSGWEDWEFWIRTMTSSFEWQKIKEPLFFYRLRSNSRDKIANQDHRQSLEQDIFRKHLEEYFKHYPAPISLLREHAILKAERANFESVKDKIYNSLSYRIGHTLLYPFKSIYKTLMKK